MVDEHLRVPAQDAVHHRAHLRLALRDEIAVHVEAVVVVAAGDTPWLVLLERPRMIGADCDGVIPRREALVAIGVRRRIQHDHERLEELDRLRLVGGCELIGDLHRRFEAGGFVAVHGVLKECDGGGLRGDGLGAGGGRLARVRELRDRRPDLVQLGQVRRIRDDERPEGPVLGGSSPRLDAYAVAGRRHQRVKVTLHHGVQRLLFARCIPSDRFGARHRLAVGAARVEVE